jgi:hypothetical protein
MEEILDVRHAPARASTPKLSLDDQRVCLWLVPGFGALLALAFATFPGFFPPLSPTLPAEEVAAFYRTHTAQIRTSMVIFNLCNIMFIPFFMVIVIQMQRMATTSRAFSYSYLSAAASGTTMFALAIIIFLIAAYRPERDAQIQLLLNDLAWMSFTAPVGFLMTQNFCLAFAIYLDRQPQPIFPRWVGHFNVITALLMAPGAFSLLYKTGPLAWDGLLAFWVRIGTYVLYVTVMFFVVRSVLNGQTRSGAGAV